MATDQAKASPALRELLSRVDETVVRWFLRQGLGPYVALLLRRQNLIGLLPEVSSSRLRRSLFESAARVELQTREMHQVFDVLQATHVDFVLLKGAALAFTLYENPACRPKGDLDIWVQVEDRARASAALESIGYRSKAVEERPIALTELVGGEEKMVGASFGQGLVELQWPPMRGEWVRHTTRIDHAAVWDRAQREEMGGVSARTMSPEDTLVHLCLHLAVNHQFSDPWLRALVDVHLLVTKRSLDWVAIYNNVTAWRLRTIIWTVLGLAGAMLGTTVPSGFLSSIRPFAWRRWLIGRLRLDRALLDLAVPGYHFRRLFIELALVDRVRNGLALIAFGILPDSAWLRARYGLDMSAPLFRARIRHVWNLLTSARA